MNLRDRSPRYYAYEGLLSAAERVVSGYKRTVDGGTLVTFRRSHRDAGLPDNTVRVTAGGDTLNLAVDAWIEQLERDGSW